MKKVIVRISTDDLREFLGGLPVVNDDNYQGIQLKLYRIGEHGAMYGLDLPDIVMISSSQSTFGLKKIRELMECEEEK